MARPKESWSRRSARTFGSPECQAVVDRLQDEGVWAPLEITGPAPYLPEGYGGTPEVGCYYLTAVVS